MTHLLKDYRISGSVDPGRHIRMCKLWGSLWTRSPSRSPSTPSMFWSSFWIWSWCTVGTQDNLMPWNGVCSLIGVLTIRKTLVNAQSALVCSFLLEGWSEGCLPSPWKCMLLLLLHITMQWMVGIWESTTWSLPSPYYILWPLCST